MVLNPSKKFSFSTKENVINPLQTVPIQKTDKAGDTTNDVNQINSMLALSMPKSRGLNRILLLLYRYILNSVSAQLQNTLTQ